MSPGAVLRLNSPDRPAAPPSGSALIHGRPRRLPVTKSAARTGSSGRGPNWASGSGSISIRRRGHSWDGVRYAVSDGLVRRDGTGPFRA